MAEQRTDAMDEWVGRVLRVPPAALAPPAPPPLPADAPASAYVAAEFRSLWQAAASEWQTAIETVDGQIAILAGRLRQTPDEDLQRIAEVGLNAITGNHKVRLMAALRDVDGAQGSDLGKRAGKAQQIVLAFQSHLAGDRRIIACENNPFGVPVKVRDTLLPVLGQMDSLLARVASGT